MRREGNCRQEHFELLKAFGCYGMRQSKRHICEQQAGADDNEFRLRFQPLPPVRLKIATAEATDRRSNSLTRAAMMNEALDVLRPE